MIEVKLVSDEDEYVPCWTLEIYHDGILRHSFSDGGEPEDASFMRDWNWVPDMIKEAYNKGVEDGKGGDA